MQSFVTKAKFQQRSLRFMIYWNLVSFFIAWMILAFGLSYAISKRNEDNYKKSIMIYLHEIVPILLHHAQLKTEGDHQLLLVELDDIFPPNPQFLVTLKHKQETIFQSHSQLKDWEEWEELEIPINQTLSMRDVQAFVRIKSFSSSVQEMIFVFLITLFISVLLFLRKLESLSRGIQTKLRYFYRELTKEDKFFFPSQTENELELLQEAISNQQAKQKILIESLQKDKEEAQKSNQAKSQFLANMSHEIRTPLNGVLGMAQLLRFTEQNAEQRRYTETIVDAGETLIGIINDVLDFSKIEAGQFKIDRIDFSLRKCLQNTVRLFEYRAKEKGLSLQLDIADSIPEYIYGDELRIRQIITNLYSNAIKFTDKGYVRLRAQAERQKDKRIQLTIAVEDSGIGIATEEQGALFKSFSQANSGIARRFGGTGLGLAISHALCRLMGGDIAVTSALGKGTEFRLTLIVEDAREVPLQEVAGEKDYPKDLQILVAEDSDMNQLIVTTMFKKLGLKIDLAQDGEEAVAMAKAKAYDLIYLDVHMPKLEGPDAARLILQTAKNKDQAILIALTADMFKEDHDLCYQSGMCDIVTKPLQFKALKESLRKWGYQSRTAAKAEAS